MILNISTETPVLLVDASIYIFQAYFALPDHWWSEKEGNPTAAVYGYTAFLKRLLKAHQPQRIAACFDESLEQCFRNEIYPDYKSSRALPDELLAFQLKACRKATELMGITCFSSERYEADDLIGSLYQRCLRSQKSIAILTRDKDLGQLLTRPQDCLWDYGASSDVPDGQAYTAHSYPQHIEERFGVKPEQLADFLALTGDAVDDIPGVPGIGKKTAQQLLQTYPTIDELLLNIGQVSQLSIRGAKTIAERLQEHKAQLLMARQLTKIVTDLGLISSVSELERMPIRQTTLKDFCQKMGFSKLYSGFDEIS